MRRDSKLLHQHALVTAVMIIFGSCGADGAMAQDATAGDEPAPAQLVTLCGGDLASDLAAFNPRQGYPVLVAYAIDRWLAVMFTGNPAECPFLLETLLVTDIPGCVREGATMCCDQATETMALSVTYESQPRWVRLPELCREPSDDELGVEVVTVPQGLTQKLFDRLRISDEYMDLADSQGRARMLWNSPPITPLNSGELSLPPPMMQGSGSSGASPISFVVTAGARSPIILAHDHPPPSPPCVSSVSNVCANNTRDKRCHPSREHWFRRIYQDGQEKWCQRAGCTCQ
jgi:hypothetical protein